ncbi:hypothetical protein DFJ77DRAFT_509799 [Powellomyces hirtus]|nr:hypothetical protein DFJ77DRAFT_509799 [Powellomyces hirtus]
MTSTPPEPTSDTTRVEGPTPEAVSAGTTDVPATTRPAAFRTSLSPAASASTLVAFGTAPPEVVPAIVATKSAPALIVAPPAAAGTSHVSATEQSNSASAKYATLISAVQQLYTTRDFAKQVEVLATHYAPTATFEDPMLIVTGTKNIAAQFHALVSIFGEIQFKHGIASSPSADASLNTTTVISSSKKTAATAAATTVETLVLPNTQIYRNGGASKIAPKEVLVEGNTFLTIDVISGKILAHKDVWLNKSFENSHIMKKASGSTTTALFKLFKVGS